MNESAGGHQAEHGGAKEALLEAVLNAAVDGIVLIHTSGIIQSVNPSIQKMFGYTPEELVGRNVKILMLSALAGGARRLSRSLSGDRRGTDHRHRPGSRRPAPRRLDLPGGSRGE